MINKNMNNKRQKKKYTKNSANMISNKVDEQKHQK